MCKREEEEKGAPACWQSFASCVTWPPLPLAAVAMGRDVGRRGFLRCLSGERDSGEF